MRSNILIYRSKFFSSVVATFGLVVSFSFNTFAAPPNTQARYNNSFSATIGSYQSLSIRDTCVITVRRGWNLLSIPLIPENPAISALFPGAITKGFYFGGFYQPVDSVGMGQAFWIKFADSATFEISGWKSYEVEQTLTKGWNLIGALTIATPTSKIHFSPGTVQISPFYGYAAAGAYFTTDTIRPGLGYWVKTSETSMASYSEWESLGLQEQRITSLAIHPNNPDIIYAGSDINLTSGVQGKLCRSSNTGLSWDTLQIAGSFSQIEIEALHPETLYTVTGTIFKSTDGGASWAQRDNGIVINPETRVLCMALNQTDPDILFAATGGSSGGKLYNSTNGGLFWQDITSGNPSLSQVYTIRVDPLNSNFVYAGTTSGAILRSTDGGAYWQAIFQATVPDFIRDIQIHPVRTNEIYAATRDTAFFRTSDGGNAWMPFDDGLPHTVPQYPESPDTSVAAFRMVIDPSEEMLFGAVGQGQTGPPYHLGSQRGIYSRSSSESIWRKVSTSEMVSTHYMDLKIAPRKGFVLYGGQGVFRLNYN